MLVNKGSGVERLVQQQAGLEGQHAAGTDRDLFPGLWVATGTCLLVPDHEIPEARDLDLVALYQRCFDRLEDGLDDVSGLLLREAADSFVYDVDDFRLGHVTRFTTNPSLVKGSNRRGALDACCIAG